MKPLLFILIACFCTSYAYAQSWKLTPENIDRALKSAEAKTNADPFRPGFHLTPPAGCMGDPNGGIYHNGWYHIFYGLQPFAHHPGGWYWAHARSKDLLHWEEMKPGLTPAFELGLQAIGSGSTIITKDGSKLAFYSQSKDGPMAFWKAAFTDSDFSSWKHTEKNPVLTLDHPKLPPYDDFWRDPFVFSVADRTFLIATADLFEENYVPVPIFEAKDQLLNDWEFKGNLFTVPKHRFRNLEVSELRPLGDKWIFLASTDAPVDKVVYFIGSFDLQSLKFNIETEGVIDYSGHYYAQETLLDDEGNLYLMAWIPGWDREWLPYYMNVPLKNSNQIWNGCFAIPRKLSLKDGVLFQKPVASFQQLRDKKFEMATKNLSVSGPVTAIDVVEGLTGDQLELNITFDLYHAAFCGINLLTNEEGQGGLSIVWSGNMLNVDGVIVSLDSWKPGDALQLQIFVDKKFVEVFVDEGRYCITRQVAENHVAGKHIALTSLGGTGKLLALEAWNLKSIPNSSK